MLLLSASCNIRARQASKWASTSKALYTAACQIKIDIDHYSWTIWSPSFYGRLSWSTGWRWEQWHRDRDFIEWQIQVHHHHTLNFTTAWRLNCLKNQLTKLWLWWTRAVAWKTKDRLTRPTRSYTAKPAVHNKFVVHSRWVLLACRVTLHKSSSLPNFLRPVNYPLLENANEFVIHGYAYADWIRYAPSYILSAVSL